jgi:hypothetical protein
VNNGRQVHRGDTEQRLSVRPNREKIHRVTVGVQVDTDVVTSHVQHRGTTAKEDGLSIKSSTRLDQALHHQRNEGRR